MINIFRASLTTLTDELFNTEIKQNIDRWINKQKDKSIFEERSKNLYHLLSVFYELKNNKAKPFENFMTTKEKQNFNYLRLLNDYNKAYRETFLAYYEKEIINLLSDKNLNDRFHEVAQHTNTLNHVKKMHEYPEQYIDESYLAKPENEPQSKFKKYLTYASLAISAGLLIASAINLLPLTMLAMSIMHICMYCTTGIGALGMAEKKYSEYKSQSKEKKRAKALQPYTSQVSGMSIFLHRPKVSEELQSKKDCYLSSSFA